jgi:hypothetical protein
MLRIETVTKMQPRLAIDAAVAYFGPDGLGLRTTARDAATASFEGAGGGVEVRVSHENGGTRVEVLSREWDEQTKDYVRKLHDWRAGQALPKPK